MAKQVDAKKLNAAEARKLKAEEIPLVLEQLRGKMLALRMQASSEKIEDTSQFGAIRRAVARVKSEQRRRALEAQQA